MRTRRDLMRMHPPFSATWSPSFDASVYTPTTLVRMHNGAGSTHFQVWSSVLVYCHGLKCADNLSYWSLGARMGGAGFSSDAVNTMSLQITGRPQQREFDGLFEFTEYLGLTLLSIPRTFG
ncbi:hypothetical protein PIB30_073036 [Stylosanthes scabra]|uniref:Uncharacterized protein n=1 Tax=Stylosanthes scabra TaxID=79078 RepID=A0ABU6RPQ5_9FABA|nr:hypothetical protein [Stylosanthes scabra]